tara:strand:- start:159 stop:1097 length:939 start_codon:yes stop_codon:yes gene_type:complete
MGVVFSLIVFLHSASFVRQAEINTIYYFATMPFYITYFVKYNVKILKILPICVFCLIIVSFYQQVCMLFGFVEFSLIFNNYPYQKLYEYPFSSFGLYRTASLFNESSQYSLILVLYIMLFLNRNVEVTFHSRIVFALCFLEVFFNESLTAYLIILIFLFYCFFKRFSVNKRVYFTVAIIIICFFNINLISLSFDKIYNTITMASSSYRRLTSAVEKIDSVVIDFFWFGKGMSWEAISFDFISVYFYSFGFIGFIFILIYLFFINLLNRSIFSITFLLNLLSNGVLHSPINILFLSFLFLIQKKLSSNDRKLL